VRRLTSRPFAVNVFAPEAGEAAPERIEAALRVLEPYGVELGLPARPQIREYCVDFDARLDVMLEERPPVVSGMNVTSTSSVCWSTITSLMPARPAAAWRGRPSVMGPGIHGSRGALRAHQHA
jgi:hypothetical protein